METKYLVTCDFEWSEHGRSDNAVLPQDVFSKVEVRRVAAAHRREFPSHDSVRVWAFDRRIGNLRAMR